MYLERVFKCSFREILVKQAEGFKNIKIDKVTVWDSNSSKDGKPATANFLSGLMKSIPPMQEMFDMAGMELPEYLGKNKVKEVKEVKKEIEIEEETKKQK